MTEDEKIRQLLKNYLAGKCTDAEREIVDQWYEAIDNPHMGSSIHNEMREDLRAIRTQVVPRPTRRTLRWFHYFSAAAVLAVAIGITLKLSGPVPPFSHTKEEVPLEAKHILPGSDKATLTLPDGRVISLDEMTVGTLRQEAGDQLVKDSEGSLFYKRSAKSTERSAEPNYHTMNIPKGGQYKLTLPDGSRVWLNSASSLKYATNHFERDRTVTLTGEAYFEVESDSRKPFRVITDRQTVTVLGTKFNINSYPDELGTKTTLIEGGVDITVNKAAHAIRLSPGQESLVDGSGLPPTVRRVETDQAIAWINGLFRFNGNTIDEVMRQLARWYDVEVVFDGKLPKDKLYGEVNRNTTADTPLELLSFFNFKHRVSSIDGKTRIIITNH
ncbi:FecR family protein [Parapedobacter indicus]|uniref:FecR family protein n=1 Tax=Parapedobacter indicus TaxID=1477437 RepID=A0A1I3F6I4_9SPHI|nr:FecR family protein [Parapedobacter indicus]PPL03583.1 FecR family protein [Parapedobacter indicus]SFI06812.1 FecR family protein [Parapedobacter indicus]